MLVKFDRVPLAGENLGKTVYINPEQVESVNEEPESGRAVHEGDYSLVKLASGDVIAVDGKPELVSEELDQLKGL